MRGTFANLVSVEPGLKLPLRHVRAVPGDAGQGAGRPALAPLADGIAILRPGRVSLFTHGLETELWSYELPGGIKAWNGFLFSFGDRLVVGPTDGEVTIHAAADGRVEQRIGIQGLVATLGDDGLLVKGVEETAAFGWEGCRAWSRRGRLGLAVTAPGRYLVTEELGRVLTCIAAATGEVCWQFRVPPLAGHRDGQRWAKIPAGFPSVVVADDRVLVYPMDGRVFLLDLGNGEVISEFQPALAGLRQTTERLIYFMSARGLVEFDHRTREVVQQIDYWMEVAPLYGGRDPTVTGYTLTTESVVWAASHGALMGVSRRPGRDGTRATWVDEIPGGIMPLAVAPLVFGNHLYFVDLTKLQVLCYGTIEN